MAIDYFSQRFGDDGDDEEEAAAIRRSSSMRCVAAVYGQFATRWRFRARACTRTIAVSAA